LEKQLPPFDIEVKETLLAAAAFTSDATFATSAANRAGTG
jgi:hypothetical protein